MVDFKKLADEAAFDAKTKAADGVTADADKANAQVSAWAHLYREVLPVLEQAIRTFSQSGIESRAAFSYDSTQIKFCFLTPLKDDGYQHEVAPVFFESDSFMLIAALGDVRFDRRTIGTSPPLSTDALIEAAVSQALATYHEEKRRIWWWKESV